MTAPDKLSAELFEAYLKTDYSFSDGDRTVVIRLGEENPDLLAYLKQQNFTSWAYLTPWNPLSFQQTDEYNHSQQQEMLAQLKDYKVCKGEGKSREGNWPGEESYFVAGISRKEAEALGTDFGQIAIMVSNENLKPELAVLYPTPAHVSL